jgi:hypothetical protein
MQITHEEAHRLIQFNSDDGLKTRQKNLLASHLEDCASCRKYAEGLREMESVLRPMLHRNWDRQPFPLSISIALKEGKNRISERMLVATRIAAVGVVFLAFFFSAWNFTGPSRKTPTPFLQSVPLIPTPSTSTMTASTSASFETCTMTSYTIEENDKLADIADRFAVSAEEIVQANSMQNESMLTGQTIVIPMCNSISTIPATTYSTMITPVLHPGTTTPGGYHRLSNE